LKGEFAIIAHGRLGNREALNLLAGQDYRRMEFIAAESLGIGSCWMGFAKFYFSYPQNYKKIGIPEGYEVHYALTLGYKPEKLKLNPRQRKYENFYRVIK
jgi:hypothetical protein